MLVMLSFLAMISTEPGSIALEAVRRGLASAMVAYDCAAGSPIACKVQEAARHDPERLTRLFTGVILESQESCEQGDVADCKLLNEMDAVARKVLESHRV
jgi:hypothetical protein